MKEIIRINNITQLHESIDYESPKHPLISVIDFSKRKHQNRMHDISVALGFYTISLKDGKNCNLKYGRNKYDFSEGSLIFTAPGQVVTYEASNYVPVNEGWLLCIHPDLIRPYSLYDRMKDFSFFSYDTHEALHVSDHEKSIITEVVKSIERELSQNIDVYSQDLIVSNIEVLLNHSNRFYGRQFITRNQLHKDVISRFNQSLEKAFEPVNIELHGIPTVKYLADKMGYSRNYLSDMLRKETGKNTLEHIQLKLVDKAKTMLLNSSDPVKEIAYSLGFEYPEHFSKFFKKQTGMSPTMFRN